MKRTLLAGAIVSSLLASTMSFAQDYNAINQSINDEYVEAGDDLVIAIPAAGFLASWINDDWEGAKQLTLSLIAAQTITEVTKQTVGRFRPNSDLAGASYKSFPSGHAAGAFSGAAYLQTRYGAAWGLPAYAGATFVAASRVHGNRHYADDVLAGASIAFLVNQYFVSPYANEGVAFNVAPNRDGGMVFGLSISNQALAYDQGRERGNGELKRRNRHRFQLDVGFNTLDSVAHIDADGQLDNSQLVDGHQPFSAVHYEYQIDEQSSLEVQFMPNETRRYGVANNNLSIGNTTYNDGTDVYMAFKQWSLGATYLKHYQVNEDLKLSGGLGMYGHLIEIEADHLRGGNYAKEKGYELMPAVSAKAQYHLVGGLSALASAQYQLAGGNNITTTEAGLSYAVNPDWEFGIKYTTSRSHWRSVDTKYYTDAVVLSFANRF
ncbi:phosphatase PAP2 family protein [Vibrio tubiashii]|uniref:undecaprenyl-diphosphate phosphatase n=1 Tax=Vibrio tubiashii ATCC 19109 TaxID=1051646 RepID=F9T6F1_9VIBR|nr:phosphatase PAP2 family protein [Vibrio tubiashii]AIW16696.1 PA-phosphatase [Vibrio tubiashii ATCC 19109]EGU54614.1 phosphoesterase, PA-phosphatase related protein [Vibrio tubiashii ATCC 19109]EIF02042.1 PA-phosphatase-like phosphoesterase [Vibrio tubiashii NCIMB 1337 = ATCC 19106]